MTHKNIIDAPLKLRDGMARATSQQLMVLVRMNDDYGENGKGNIVKNSDKMI